MWDTAALRDFRRLQTDVLQRVASHVAKFDTQAVLVFRRTGDFAHSLYQTIVEYDRTDLGFVEFRSHFAPMFDYRAQIRR